MENENIRLEFIKNVLDVDVDGLKGINHYTIKGMYYRIHTEPDGSEWADITHKLVDDFYLTWDEIEEDGGISQVNKDLEECYGVEIG